MLPRDAHARRRYCAPACVARAYRARRRAERAKQIQALVVRAYATAFVPDATAVELLSADRVMAMMRCPVCGVVVWKRIGRRRDAVYCSPRCRTRGWRERCAATKDIDHDGDPSPH